MTFSQTFLDSMLKMKVKPFQALTLYFPSTSKYCILSQLSFKSLPFIQFAMPERTLATLASALYTFTKEK